MEKEVFQNKKRINERIPVSLPVKLFCSNGHYSGIAMNVSKNGMYIKTGITLPAESNFHVCMPYNEDELKVPVKLVRLAETYGFFDAVGVEVLNPPEKYLEFVGGLMTAL